MQKLDLRKVHFQVMPFAVGQFEGLAGNDGKAHLSLSKNDFMEKQ